MHQTLVGDGRQDGSALGRDVGIVLDGKEVGSASLVDVFLFLGIEIELTGVLAAVAGFGVGTQRSGIVATHLVDTSAERSRAVVLARDDVGVGHEAALEVRTNGRHEDDEKVFCGRFHTHLSTHADEQRTDVQRSTRFVGRDEVGVEADNLLDGGLGTCPSGTRPS